MNHTVYHLGINDSLKFVFSTHDYGKIPAYLLPSNIHNIMIRLQTPAVDFVHPLWYRWDKQRRFQRRKQERNAYYNCNPICSKERFTGRQWTCKTRPTGSTMLRLEDSSPPRSLAPVRRQLWSDFLWNRFASQAITQFALYNNAIIDLIESRTLGFTYCRDPAFTVTYNGPAPARMPVVSHGPGKVKPTRFIRLRVEMNLGWAVQMLLAGVSLNRLKRGLDYPVPADPVSVIPKSWFLVPCRIL